MGPNPHAYAPGTARPVFSLRWQILVWFFVNLLVLSVASFLFLRSELRLDFGSLIAGPTSDRLENIAAPLAAQLYDQPKDRWGELLKRAAGRWRSAQLRIGLFRDDGTYLAGDIAALPGSVQHAIEAHERRHHGPLPWHTDQRASTHPVAGPPVKSFAPAANVPPDEPPEGDPHEGDGPPRDGPHPFDPGPPPPPPPPAQRQPVATGASQQGSATGPHDKFLLRTDGPKLYWVGVHLGEMDEPLSASYSPSVTLVFASNTLRGGGLLFDYYPWVWFAVGLVVASVLIWLPFVTGVLGSIRRMLGVAQDVAQGSFQVSHVSQRRDELGGLSRALAHMIVRLEEAANGQKRFLGDTAHELLSPLSRLEMALSILEHQPDAASRERYTAQALEDVRHTSTLVHDLLAFTKANLRGPSTELAAVNLHDLAEKAVAREAAADKVCVEVPASLQALADPDLLMRALANAVRNAVRYAGQAGPIVITASRFGDDSVALHITDQGPGVPPESLDRLFEPFFRPEAARTRETGGNGLGLAIVKSCVEACGGRVSVHNLEPAGLQLTFVLPAVAGEYTHDELGRRTVTAPRT